MILVISRSSFESTTDQVIDYLRSLGAPFVRLNGDDLEGEAPISFRISGDGADCVLELGGVRLRPQDISAVWFRRWRSQGVFDSPAISETAVAVSSKFAGNVSKHLDFESRRLSAFLFSLFSHADWLSEPRTASANKLEVLTLARESGLEIPATLITTRREELLEFVERFGRVITKPMSEAPSFVVDDRSFPMYTSELDVSTASGLPPRFFPSLFQELLDKEFELRVFYLEGQCYAAAIFSQSDDRTRTDFRRYDFVRPNRIVPYRLPEDIEKRVHELMRRLDLETGSLDFVRTRDRRCVFLEVNPIGQFGMISDPCNFHLERRVAELLFKKANHGKA